MITIKFMITDEDAENGNGELGRRKGRKNTMRRKKQRSKKNVMAPAKRRQEEGAGVKSCQIRIICSDLKTPRRLIASNVATV